MSDATDSPASTAGASLPGDAAWKRGLVWALYGGCALFAFSQIGILAYVFVTRLTYPMDIEWLEGHALEESWRVFHGNMPLYGDPAAGVQTQIYPPFYFLLVASLGKVFGLDYWTGRLVSVVAFTSACIAMGTVVSRHARERRTGGVFALLAVAAVAVAYPVVSAWYDIARVDSLALGLIVVGAAVATHDKPTPKRAALAGVFLALAVFTKQTHVLFAAWITVFTFARNRRAGLVMAAVAAAIAGVALAALQLVSHGWFARWMTIATSQEIRTEVLANGEIVLVRFAPYVVVVALIVPFMIGRRWLSATSALWCGLFAVSLPVGMLPLMKGGGAWNNLITILFFAPAAAALLTLDYLDGPARAARHRGLATAAFMLLAAIYLGEHALSVAPYAPTDERRADARALNHFVASLGDDVVIPSHPFLARRNGAKNDQVLVMGYIELQMAARGPDARKDLTRIGAPWLVLTDFDPDGWIRGQVDGLYALECTIDPTVATWATIRVAAAVSLPARSSRDGRPHPGKRARVRRGRSPRAFRGTLTTRVPCRA